MAIVQISRIQIRRGLQQDLPQLASAEMGWSLDAQRLFIGNGLTTEGAPVTGVTEILTEHTDLLSRLNTYTFKNLASGTEVVTGVDSSHPIKRTLQDKLDDVCSVKDFGAVGDGITDDTAAIQRALDRVYGSSQGQTPVFHHRTVLFPTGDYRVTSTIFIPPYTRIQGEGKRTTSITGSFAGPLAQYKDSFGQTGVDFGAPDINNARPDAEEYHFNDIMFFQRVPTFDQSCLVIDGCTSSTFNRVMFRGGLNSTSSDFGSNSLSFPSFDVARTDSTFGGFPAGLKVTNNSNYLAAKNITISQSDFFQISAGIEMNQDCHGNTINNCFFDFNYNYILLGNNSPSPADYAPYAISILNNYFRYSAREGVVCSPFVTQIMSMGNSYLGYGQTDWPGEIPVTNPYNEAQYPALVFNADNNYSIGDSFTPGLTGSTHATTSGTNVISVSSTTGMYVGAAIKFNGVTSFGGIQFGRQYYIASVDSNNDLITISQSSSGPTLALTTGTGTMQYTLNGPIDGVPYVQDNGYVSYSVTQDIGVVDGRKTMGRARTTTLANAASFSSAALNYIPASYSNLTVEYSVAHAGAQRVGTMVVTRVGTTFIWNEEYSETGPTGIVLQANTTTGDIEYTSTSSGAPATLTYNLNYFS